MQEELKEETSKQEYIKQMQVQAKGQVVEVETTKGEAITTKES